MLAIIITVGLFIAKGCSEVQQSAEVIHCQSREETRWKNPHCFLLLPSAFLLSLYGKLASK